MRKQAKSRRGNNSANGKKLFEEYYTEQFGEKRWSTLLPALKVDTQHCCMVNKYGNERDLAEYTKSYQHLIEQIPYLSIKCLTLRPADDGTEYLFPKPIRDSNMVMSYYMLDAASVLAVDALDIQPEDTQILDLCAAPGGKSLAILQHLTASNFTLHCNERSDDRRKRLQRVLHDYLPLHLHKNIKITGYDGTVPAWFKPNYFDKVLVDAPCSSDRHLVHEKEELAKWNPMLTREMSKKQILLLITALHAVKPGGTVVYATCSLSQWENDHVIEQALSKKQFNVQILKRSWPIGEETKYGWIVLPDQLEGWGPLFIAVLQKVNE